MQPEESKELLLMQQGPMAQIQCPKVNQLCTTCTLKAAKYLCPKCQVPYCSVPCYKNHSQKCVEAHALEVEKDSYRGIKADFDTQRETRKMLNRVYRQFEDEPIEPYNLEQQVSRLEDLLAQEQLHLQLLTLDEQKQFSQFIQDQDGLAQYLPAWRPWWTVKEGTFSLYVLDEVREEESKDQIDEQVLAYIDQRNQLKEKLRTIVPFEKISKKQPHPDIDNHLCNMVLSIALIARSMNGDLWSIPEEFTLALQQLSFKTSTHQIFETCCNAYRQVIEHSIQIDSGIYKDFTSVLIDDAIAIYSNKFYVVETLLIAFDLLHLTQQLLEKQKLQLLEEPEQRKQCKSRLVTVNLMKNKLLYFTSLAMSKPHTYFSEVQEQLKVVKQQDLMFAKEAQEVAEIKESKLVV